MSFPIEDRATAEAVIAHLQRQASAHQVSLPTPPAEPTGCCDSDCAECVWLGWYAEVAYWRDEAGLILEP